MPNESSINAWKYMLRWGNMIVDEMSREREGRENRPPPILYGFVRLAEDMSREGQSNDNNSDSDYETAESSHSPIIETEDTNHPDVLTIQAVIDLLATHGCTDITAEIDTHDTYPCRFGGFGDLYSGKLTNGTTVAIKTIRPRDVDSNTPGLLKKAARELHTWSKCDHPNVMKLIGIARIYGKLGMVSEWAPNGNLSEYIGQNRNSVDRCNLSTQVSKGLEYLHGMGMVHGDLKACNVVVSEDGVPMITDFGHAYLSKHSLAISTTSHNQITTMRWTAPEILKGESKRSFPADVYALGMTILEIITGKFPYAEVDDAEIYGVIRYQGKFPSRPKAHIPLTVHGNLFWAVLTSCWSREIQDRPTAAEVREQMEIFTSDKLKPKFNTTPGARRE